MNNKYECVVDYQGLPYETQRKIDQKAYERYFNSYFSDDSEDELLNGGETQQTPLTFNTWYGTYLHQKGIQPFLRKYKLQKLIKYGENI
jgi:hypothetical protein